VLLAALMSIGLVFSGTAAQADTCYSTRTAWLTQAYAICTNYPTNTTGKWKVAVTCKNGFGWSAYREGGFVSGNGNASWVTCPFGYTVTSHWYLRG
jgi:hypothetical protein